MTASTAEDVEPGAANSGTARPSAAKPADDASHQETRVTNVTPAKDKASRAERDAGAADDADSFSWDSSTWSASSWDSSSGGNGSTYPASSSYQAPAAAKPSREREKDNVPLPSDQVGTTTTDGVGKTRPAASAKPDAGSGLVSGSRDSSSREAASSAAAMTTRAEPVLPSSRGTGSGRSGSQPLAGTTPSPAAVRPGATPPGATVPVSPASGAGADEAPSAVERLGAAASVFNSKLDKGLDRGRQAWRSMTGPNNWLAGRSGATEAPPSTGSPSAPAPSSPPPAPKSAPAGYSGSSSFGSGSGYSGPAGNSGYGSSAGYADPAPATPSYGGPAGGAPASAGSSAFSGTSTYRRSGNTGPSGVIGGGAAAGAAAGAAYSGGRQGAPGGTATRTRPAVSVKKGKGKDSRRQAQLTLSRVEPWSVMKFSFIVSVVAFIVLFVAVALLYMALSSLGVFDSLQHTVNTLTSSKDQAGTNVKSWFSESRILGYTGMLGAFNIVLITALSTIGAVVYNLIAQGIGGIEVTLRETD
ncbi:MAG TPA: DUF3566 domain-containing protein [Trebonia sp.]|nr:DUF3566 domain-containing protein [Trebonia sp.]